MFSAPFSFIMSPEEAYALKVGSDPFVSDGTAYFTLNWIENDEYASSIYRYDGKDMTRVTFGNCEKNPKVHNGSLYYISYDKEKERLMVLEPLKESREIYSNKSIKKYLFHNEEILLLAKDESSDKEPFATSHIKYRFDTTGYLRKKLKLVALGSEPEVIVEGEFNIEDVASNGKRVIFSAAIEEEDRNLQDIYEVDLSTGKYRKITEGKGKVNAICLSPEGEIAYSGHRNGLTPWSADKLIFPETGKEIEIGKTAGNSVNSDLFVGGAESIVFANGKYFLIGEEGPSSFVYSYNGEVARITEDGISVKAFHVNADELAYIYTSPEFPSVLHFKQDINLNPEVKVDAPEHFVKDGMDAWIYLAGSDRPTVLAVHGGPHTAYGNAYYVEFNYLKNQGFNVLFGNPRGSDGYGEEFSKACVGDWGGKDLEDLIGFMDEAMKRYSLKDNFAITGGSYGGYMTNAAITKTARFKCAIAERCVSNLMSMCGTSDIGFWFNAVESNVIDPFSEEGMEKLLKASPITYVKNAKTPTMFIHGENDYRCPIEQSEQMFTGLKLNGVESVLVRYPGDSHEHARRGVPKNMKDRLKRKSDWFSKYLDPN